MARTYKTILKDQLESNFDVDLTPVLSLMVCLIPIMLLSTVFVRITVIETPLPQVVEQALQEDREKKNRETTVSLEMDETKGFVLLVKNGDRTALSHSFPKKNGEWDL